MVKELGKTLERLTVIYFTTMKDENKVGYVQLLIKPIREKVDVGRGWGEETTQICDQNGVKKSK